MDNDINILPTLEINGYKLTLVMRGINPHVFVLGQHLYGRWSQSNHSGLGNALKKARFSQSQVKQVYAFLKQTA